ncbi:MAG TPA: hypothetical protein VHW03_04550 [Chthoniobacterales bacterium]|jgi:hypothetical protein|nr:hypothetical protein [Chthoniobacterales bacterium]
MTIEDLGENAVIADFDLEPVLAAVTLRNHDYAGMKAGGDAPVSGDDDSQEQTAVITITAKDAGNFGPPGSGIRLLSIEAEIETSELAAAPDLLDNLAEKVDDRLQPSTTIWGVIGREAAFSNAAFRVLGILNRDGVERDDFDLNRRRTIRRTFVCAQLASVIPDPPGGGGGNQQLPLKAPHGIMDLLDYGGSVSSDQACWTNAAVDGVVVGGDWSGFEPSDGTYDFSLFTSAVTLAQANGKQLGIYIGALAGFPSWLDPVTVSTPGGKFGDVLAVPWDVSFLDPWKTFIAALGAQFDGDFDYIVMGGLGAVGESILSDDPAVQAQFDNLGGLDAWQGSCTAIVGAFAAAFPTTAFIFSVENPYGINNADGAAALRVVVPQMATLYPFRFGIKNSTLSSNTHDVGIVDILLHDYRTTNPVGQQCVSTVAGFGHAPPLGGLANALNAGIRLGDNFVEVFDVDCSDPANAPILQAASAEMARLT